MLRSARPQFAGASVQDIFPAEVPKELDFTHYQGGKTTLIDGKLQTWLGPTDRIESVVMTRNAAGQLQPVTVGELAAMGPSDALRALHAAKKAYGDGHGDWPSAPLSERITALGTLVDEMKKHRDTTAGLIMAEIGKTKKDAYKEFDRTVEYIERTLELAKELDQKGATLEQVGSVLKKEALKPRGVVYCLGPSNYPLNETFTTLIPALLMGNTVICKLPKTGSISVTPLYEAFAKSFPPGVINFVSGDGATLSKPIMESGDVDTLAFIGSTRAAEAIAKLHPNRLLLNEVLGLGAKNAGIILPDVKIDDSLIKEIVTGALSFNGQRCTALKVLFAPKSRAEEFTAKLSDAVGKLKVGLPNDPDTQITPLPIASIPWYKTLLDDAVSKGAKIENPGGGEIEGTVFKPAVLSGITPEMKIYSQEQFGPLVPVVTYDDDKPGKLPKGLDQVVDYVTKLEVGQQASVFGQDPKTLQAVIKGLQNQVCRININSQCQRGPDELPFVGRKASAVGTLSIKEALLRFSLPQLLTGNATPENESLLSQLEI